jgi:hypothetical protein
MKGQYIGFYKYHPRVQERLSRGQTFFDINITEADGDNFFGTVKDEPAGQPGTGTITGVASADKISFIKQMSIATSITADGQNRTYNSRHPKIYYEGVFADNKFQGTWKIKFGFIFAGLIPIPVIPTTGTWEMRKKD